MSRAARASLNPANQVSVRVTTSVACAVEVMGRFLPSP
jgi:hypothetical protein